MGTLAVELEEQLVVRSRALRSKDAEAIRSMRPPYWSGRR